MAGFNRTATTQIESKSSNLVRGTFNFLLISIVTVVVVLSLCGSRSNISYVPLPSDSKVGLYRNITQNKIDAKPTLGDTQNLTNISTIKTIIFWTGFYARPASGWKVKMGEMICGQFKCKLITNQSYYREADAFIFHLRCPSWVKDMKKLLEAGVRLPNQRWILYNRESAAWTKGEELEPAGNYFNWTMGYRRDNSIYIPTAVVNRGQYQDGFDPSKNYLDGKPGHVVVLMSMCNWGGYIPRSKYIDFLKKSGLRIDIIGNCGKKCGSLENCAKIMKTYKFVLAIENSLCDDYVSEKAYLNGFRTGVIPIVVSKANVSDPTIFPPGSFVNALQFSTTAALVEHVNKVGTDPNLYNSYFKWRANWTFTLFSENEGHTQFPDDYFCPLCEKLHTDEKSEIISDLRKWYEQEKCYPFPTK